MNGQFPEEEKRKKRAEADETGSKEENPEADVLAESDIDPADFFDPEEFGLRKHCEPFRP